MLKQLLLLFLKKILISFCDLSLPFVIHVLLFRVFVCVFDNIHFSFSINRNNYIKNIFICTNNYKNNLLVFLYFKKLTLVYDLCKLHELCKLYEVCKLYELYIELKSLRIT